MRFSLSKPLLAACALLALGGLARAESLAQSVFTETNATAGNHVLIFTRDHDGQLQPAGSTATGGTGTGSGLGSQGAVALTDDHRWLLAVNAGSDSISVLQLRGNDLVLTDVVASGGHRPISVTVDGNLVYVLNAGGQASGWDSITGFYLTSKGKLLALPGSTRPLSTTNAGPAQISFAPSGDTLMVTEKGTNLVDTFAVNDDGIASWGKFTASAGATPFGFAFTPTGTAVVSEAFGGAPGASRLSSYTINGDGVPVSVTAELATTQTAACWVAVARNGKYAYAANTGSNTVTGVTVGRDGSLTLLEPNGITATTGVTPIDVAVSNNSRYLYVLTAGDHAISQYQIGADGSLTSLGAIGGLPAGSVGLVAR